MPDPIVATEQFGFEKVGRAVSAMDWPASRAVAVTPSDTDELVNVSRGIFVGNTGDLTVVLGDDSAAVTFENIADGTLLPLRVRQVLSTGTTATGIVALY